MEHETLSRRLREAGIIGTALKWINSFLEGRSQSTSMPPFVGQERPTLYGVPQGASISPLLFNIYLSPLMRRIRRFGITGYNYADDTQLLVTFKDPKRHPPPEDRGVPPGHQRLDD